MKYYLEFFGCLMCGAIFNMVWSYYFKTDYIIFNFILIIIGSFVYSFFSAISDLIKSLNDISKNTKDIKFVVNYLEKNEQLIPKQNEYSQKILDIVKKWFNDKNIFDERIDVRYEKNTNSEVILFPDSSNTLCGYTISHKIIEDLLQSSTLEDIIIPILESQYYTYEL